MNIKIDRIYLIVNYYSGLILLLNLLLSWEYTNMLAKTSIVSTALWRRKRCLHMSEHLSSVASGSGQRRGQPPGREAHRRWNVPKRGCGVYTHTYPGIPSKRKPVPG